MDKETDALLKIARERENKKDILAYQKLKEISTGRTYSEVQDISSRSGSIRRPHDYGKRFSGKDNEPGPDQDRKGRRSPFHRL